MRIVSVLLFSLFLFASCSTPETAPVNANNRDIGEAEKPVQGPDVASSDPAPNELPPVPPSKDAVASREEVESKAASETGLGPTDTLRALNDADMKKDGAKIKSLLSRASVKMIEDTAKTQGITVDALLTMENGAPIPVEREMRNEVIDGNNATVEVKNSVLGSFEKNYLVRENGQWRVALDKFRDATLQRMKEMQKDAPLPVN
jgi:hypothetical protein